MNGSASTIQLVPLLEPLRPEMEEVMRVLRGKLAQIEEPLRSRLSTVLMGGKQLRPALVILTGRLFGAPIAPFYRLAAALEILHTATLVHDDLVDGASLRRGQRTIHTTWPASATVLAGDYLMARSAAMVAQLDRPRVLGVFAEMLCTVCAGEIKQAFASAIERRDRATYFQRIEAKTASLCAAATEMAAILANAQETQITALRRYGHDLGTAFQIVDDVLDLTGDEGQLGKPAGSDLRQGLVTLPVLIYFEQESDTRAVDAVFAGETEPEQVQAAVEAIRTSGAIEAALAEAQSLARQSQQALESVPDNAAREMLHRLADYAVTREH